MENARTRLPAHLRAFLYSCIDSLEQLEILMLLRGSGDGWRARDVAQELGIPDSRARAYLDALVARGLLRATIRGEISYEFKPSSESLSRYTNELSVVLAESRADVMRFVASLPPSSVRSFASAFKLRDQE